MRPWAGHPAAGRPVKRIRSPPASIQVTFPSDDTPPAQAGARDRRAAAREDGRPTHPTSRVSLDGPRHED
jgi:hypothetical protein